MRIRKTLSLIVVALVMLMAGLFAGCGDKYSNMTIELDKQEITLLLNGTEEEKTTTFTATISGIGEEVSGEVVFEQTDSSIVSFEILSFEDNVSTIKVTALLGGKTTAKVKSEEAPLRVYAEIEISVVEEVTNIEYVPTYKPYVTISDPTILSSIEEVKQFSPTVKILNTAEFIKFSPATTTQKGIVYTLIGSYSGVIVDNVTGFMYYTNDALKITEAGEVTMVGTMEHTGYATVRATSASNPELFVDFELRVIYPIEQLVDLGFSENGEDIEEMILSNGRFREGIKSWQLDFGEFQDDYNLVCWSDNDLILEVEKTSATTFTIRSGVEGTTTFHVKVEVVGYEQHYTMASIPVRVVQFPDQLYIDKMAYNGNAIVKYVYDDYQNGLGLPISITAGPIGAYNKNIVMEFLNAADSEIYLDGDGYFNTQYLKLRYDANTYVNINDIIDGSNAGTKIYAMSAGNYATPLSLKFLAEWTKYEPTDSINEEVYNIIEFNLKVGARKININYPDNKFYLNKGNTSKLYYSLEGTNQNENVFADTMFAKADDENIVEVANETDILQNEDLTGKYVEITGLKEGATQIELSLSNGVKVLYDIYVFEEVKNFTVNIGSVEENNNIAQISLKNDGGLKSVETATLKVNTILDVKIDKYFLDENNNYVLTENGTVSDIIYTLTDNDAMADYATINTNGILRTYMATPSDVTITIDINIKYLVLSGNGIVNLEEKNFSFTIKVYVPITSVELNTYEITLYDYDTLRYYDKYKGQLQILANNYGEIQENLTKILCVNVYPQNATNNSIQINFSNISALESQGNNRYRAVSSGLGTDVIPCDIEIIVQDFNIYYVKICRVYVKFPNLSSNISLLNVERKTIDNEIEMPYLYFDGRKGLNNENNTFKIEAVPVGTGLFGTALLNTDLYYKYIQHPDDGGVNPVLSVDENGLVTPLRSGMAYIDVIAKDSFTNSTEYSNFKRIKVKVADGQTEITSIEINTAREFMGINTIEGLKLNYVLTDTLNFATINFVPLGLINGETIDFTGTINGADSYGAHSIIGFNININSIAQKNIFGLVLSNKGVIKNLKVVVSNLSVNLENSDASNFDFGIISAINNGIIKDCQVDIINGTINTNANINNIGAITGLNNAESCVENCEVFGNLVINQGQSVVSVQSFKIGGLVGENLGDIIGHYDFYNTMPNEFEKTNSSINIIFNKNGVSSVYHENIRQNSAFGLIAGYGEGVIDGLFASGTFVVNGYSNIGGIVGSTNNATIQNCYFNGSVFGYTYVGGIAGNIKSTQILNCVVEMLDEESENIIAKVKAINYVGGLIGSAKLSTIEGCFVKSYVSRSAGNNFEGDIFAELTASTVNEEVFVGGLIAELKASHINISYFNANISIKLNHNTVNNNVVFANGFVGGIAGLMNNQVETIYEGSIKNAYAMGSVNITCVDANGNNIVNPTNVVIGGIVGKYNLATLGEESFFNTYNTMANNIIGENETTENPETSAKCNFNNTVLKEDIILNALPDNSCWNYNDDENSGYPFLTYNSNKMLIIIPENLIVNIKNTSMLSSIDTLKQNKHIKIDENKLVLFYHLNENESYINILDLNKIIDVNFVPANVDRASLFYEIANTNIITKLSTGEFKILGTGTTQITIKSKYNLEAVDTFTIEILPATTNIKVFALADFSGNEITEFADAMKEDKINLYYQIIGSANIMLEYSLDNSDDKNKLAIIGAPWQNESDLVEILATKTQMINCIEETDTIYLTVKPFIYVNDSFGNPTKQYLPFEKGIAVKISVGTQNVLITPEQAEISTKDIATFKIETVSDLLPEDILPQIKVDLIEKDSQGVTIYTDASHLIDLSLNSLDVNGKSFDVSLKIKEIERNNQLFLNEQIFRITVSILKTHTLDGLGNSQYINKEFLLTVKPQKISFVEMAYFSDGEQYIDENGVATYNFNEVAGNIIKTGTIGILKIKMFPANSMDNISKIELTATSNMGSISFQQVLFDENKYVTLTPYPAQIVNGTHLLAKSNANGSYDGTLYVKCLIPSSILEGTEYKLNLKFYYINSNLTYDTSLNLTAESPKKLELIYNDSADYLNKTFLVQESEEVVNLTVTKLQDLSTLKIIVQDEMGNVVTNGITVSNLIDKKVDGIKTTANFTIKANTILIGKELNVFAEITEHSGNKEFKYLSNVLKLTVVDEIIESVSINGTVVENNNIIMRKPYGGTYALEFKVNSTRGQNIVADFNNFNIAKILNETAMKYWFNSANRNLNVFEEGDDLTGVNYKIYSNENNTLIEPLRVSQDNLVGVFAYYYDNDGILNPFNYEGENYSIADKTSGRYLVGDKSIFIIRVEFKTDIYLQGRYENPVPIYNLEEFNSMREDGNYILMNNLYLGNEFETIKTKIASFDGNGYVLGIGGFANTVVDGANIAETGNFGLFEQIEQGDVLKNIHVKYIKQAVNPGASTNESVNITVENYKNVNFGGIVAINNGGSIYNCKVSSKEGETVYAINITTQSILNENVVVSMIGGLVAQNNGFISYSKIEDTIINANKGFVAGLVAQNNSLISNSYVKNIILNHSASTDTSTLESSSLLGGMFVQNTGKVLGSYVYCNNSTSSLIFNGLIGGFGVINTGTITDCYSNVKMQSQVKTAGFVYSALKGTIVNCYSKSASTSASTSRAAFVGIDGTTTLGNSLTINNCYYLNAAGSVFSTYTNYPATKLNLTEFVNLYYYNGFVFRNDNGIWNMTTNGPELIEANRNIISKQKLKDKTNDAVTGEVIYTYIDEDTINYLYGTKNNPIIISSAQQFLRYVLTNNGTVMGTNYVNENYYSIIANIDLSEYVLNSEYGQFTYETILTGGIEANGCIISGINITAPRNVTNIVNAGLISKLEGATIKNLVLEPAQVYANNIQNVGTLAGTISGTSTIINVVVNAEKVVVQGRNRVGGVAGIVFGDSVAENISSNISANASYKTSDSFVNNYSFSATDSGYVGGVFGVVDLRALNRQTKAPIYNIEVVGKVKIFGQNVGGAFGFVGTNSFVDYVKVIVEKENFVKASFSAGGIASENRGHISRAYIENKDQIKIDARENFAAAIAEQNINYFTGYPIIIGGIVGFNNGGIIDNSYSKVDVRNVSSVYAGGIVGVMNGGNLYSNYATGSVLSGQYIGGITAVASNSKILVEAGVGLFNSKTLFNFASKNNLALNASVNIVNCIALNEWLTETDANIGDATAGGIIAIVEDETLISAQDNYYLSSSLNLGSYFTDLHQRYGFKIAKENANNNFLFKYFSADIWTNTKQFIFTLPKLKNANALSLKPANGTYLSTNKISNLQELMFALNSNEAYTLVDNIYIYGIELANNEFGGTIDGCGFDIVGLTKTTSSINIGLFATTNNATIKNLGLVGINFDISVGMAGAGNGTSVGGFVGIATDTQISNCFVNGNISLKNGSVVCAGGLVGTLDGSTILNCYSQTNIISDSTISVNAAGFAGFVTRDSHNTIENGYYNGKIVLKDENSRSHNIVNKDDDDYNCTCNNAAFLTADANFIVDYSKNWAIDYRSGEKGLPILRIAETGIRNDGIIIIKNINNAEINGSVYAIFINANQKYDYLVEKPNDGEDYFIFLDSLRLSDSTTSSLTIKFGTDSFAPTVNLFGKIYNVYLKTENDYYDINLTAYVEGDFLSIGNYRLLYGDSKTSAKINTYFTENCPEGYNYVGARLRLDDTYVKIEKANQFEFNVETSSWVQSNNGTHIKYNDVYYEIDGNNRYALYSNEYVQMESGNYLKVATFGTEIYGLGAGGNDYIHQQEGNAELVGFYEIKTFTLTVYVPDAVTELKIGGVVVNLTELNNKRYYSKTCNYNHKLEEIQITYYTSFEYDGWYYADENGNITTTLVSQINNFYIDSDVRIIPKITLSE